MADADDIHKATHEIKALCEATLHNLTLSAEELVLLGLEEHAVTITRALKAMYIVAQAAHDKWYKEHGDGHPTTH